MPDHADAIDDLQGTERQFRLLVESVEDYAIFMLTPDGRVQSWNTGAERITGYRQEEILGQHFGLFYTAEDRGRGRPGEALEIAAREGRVESDGWRLRADGSRFRAHMVITAIRDDGGSLIGYGNVTRDRTDRRQADVDREQPHLGEHTAVQQVRRTLETITDGFYAIDQEWRFTYVNSQAEDLLRRPRHELLGQVIWNEFPEAVDSTFERMYRRAVDERRSVDFVEFFPPLGRWFEVRAHPSDDGLSVYFHDVTERIRADEELRAREQQLRAVLDVLPLPVFIADASGKVIAVNRAVREFWGEGAPTLDNPEQYAEYVGWWPDSGRRIEAREWALARTLATGALIGPEELEVETFNGERRTILNYARPIRDERGEILGAVAINVDLTERKAHEQAEVFLAEAARTLASSLDYERTVRQVARLAVSRIADWCVVYGPTAGGIERLALAANDRELEATAAELTRRYPPGDDHLVQQVFRTGESVLVDEIPDAVLEATAQDEAHLSLLRAIGFRSVMMVPLMARGEVVGAIMLGRTGPGRPYGPDDLTFAQRLAGAAGLAADNARLYQEARRRADEEEALRRAAAAVGDAFTIDQVIQQIADSALQATEADGSFVERIDIECDEIALVASAGTSVPPRGARGPYTGSIAQEVIERGEPLLIENVGASDAGVLRDLAIQCDACSALTIPLVDAGEPIGVLVLVRRTGSPPFRPDEKTRANTFGELASLAFRKIHLLEESERRREELEQVTESRAALIRGFSHDLKNPLGAADGFLSLLDDEVTGMLDAAQRSHVQRVRALLRASLDLIDDLVELQRAEAGQLQIKPSPFDARLAAKEMAGEYRPQAEARGLTIDLRLPRRLPAIHTDASRVRHILGNLLSNAVKYTQEGGVTITVDVRERAGGERFVAIAVTDTGPGIPRSEQHLLFREFSRIQGAGEDGAGLGLAISQRIAAALGGNIEIESDEGQGSTFTLLLPTRD
jgi:PAS domain S-box-containing protein